MSENYRESLNTLSNAVELATSVIEQIGGDLVASTINGVYASNSVLAQTIAAKIQSCLKNEIGVV